MKTIIKYSLLSFFGLVLLCIHSATAQEQSLRFERITIEDGLPNPSVINIIQDRQGFMWFGTVSGVVRYDGYEMKIYYPAAVPQDSLPERDLPRLYQDKAGNIWVTLQYQQAKIFRYDTQTDQFLPIAFDPGAENREWFVPSTLFEDKLGRLLLGSWDHGLFVIDVAKEEDGTALSDFPFKVFKHNPNVPRSIPNNAILKMTEDGDGNIWIATEGGLCRFTPGVDTFETFLFAGDRPGLSEFCQDVFYEAPHTLWVGSDQHGLLKFDLETEEFVKQYQHDAGKPYSIAHHKVLKITKVRDGKFWIGTYGFLDIFDPEKETFTHISDNNSETWRTNFRWNNALITDYSGNIWAATWQKGIYKFNFDKGQFHFYEPSFFQKEIKAANSLWMYVEDHQSNLWLSDVY